LETYRERRFDRRYGVDTTGKFKPVFVGVTGEVKALARAHQPSAVGLFARFIRLSGANPTDFTFIDLGCGKGRTLLLAARSSFRKVVGVELDSALCETARQNAATWKTQRHGAPITIIEGNAAEFEPPSGNLFIYMFCPFDGAVFHQVAERLAQWAGEAGRRVIVAYVADYQDPRTDIIEKSGVFRRRDMPARRPRGWLIEPPVSYFDNTG
jgi:predicted RNA methylase